jgi:hypothetical protein
MKHIPESYELDEADIKAAIELWLNETLCEGVAYNFNITIEVSRLNGLDNVVSAIAVKE